VANPFLAQATQNATTQGGLANAQAAFDKVYAAFVAMSAQGPPTAEALAAVQKAAAGVVAAEERAAAARDKAARQMEAVEKAIARERELAAQKTERAAEKERAARERAAAAAEKAADKEQAARDKADANALRAAEKADAEAARRRDKADADSLRQQDKADRESLRLAERAAADRARQEEDAERKRADRRARLDALRADPTGPLRQAVGAFSVTQSLVGKSSPVAVQQFERAVADMQAVLGRILIPVLNSATQVFRTLGSYLNGLSEQGETAVRAIIGGAAALALFKIAVVGVQTVLGGGVLGILGLVASSVLGVVFASGKLQPVFDAISGAFASVLEMVGTAVEAAVPAMLAFAKVLGEVVTATMNGIRRLLTLVGIDLPDAPEVKPKDNTNAAVRQTSTGGVDDVLRRAREQAFTLGGGGKSDAAKTASAAEAMNKKVGEIADQIRAIPDKIIAEMGRLPEHIVTAVAAWWAGLQNLGGALAEAADVDGRATRVFQQNPGLADWIARPGTEVRDLSQKMYDRAAGWLP
jgi:chemotaxis protein histidine kinase CheA